MGFLNRGGLTAIMAVIAMGTLIGSSLPQVYWSQFSADISTDIHISIKFSLWQNCTLVNQSIIECNALSKPKESDFQNEQSAERIGTVAAVLLAALLHFAVLLPVCCRSKCFVLLIQILALIFCCAAIGCWYRYHSHTLNPSEVNGNFKFGLGFWLAAVALAASFTGTVGGCFVQKSEQDAYGYLA